MTINKLYSKKILYKKTIYIILLPLIIELFAMLSDPQNAIIFLFVTMFFLGLFYALPFMLTLKVLCSDVLNTKSGENLKKLILYDLLYLLCPIIISTVLCDSIFLILDSESIGQGIFSILTISIVLLITLIFWLLYFLFKKRH
ncbi:MAG: hypothetical protein A2Y15_05900 [Clostridiales bacterium GWF2_36_10]|nr:MAG: hypothetical protein A2Y15_05900 [Clostridiales bacterium GWF2_36_10]HAN21609.1 hypothetical protein [Clostridiales bacterium]